jgi:hypothetical protein
MQPAAADGILGKQTHHAVAPRRVASKPSIGAHPCSCDCPDSIPHSLRNIVRKGTTSVVPQIADNKVGFSPWGRFSVGLP